MTEQKSKKNYKRHPSDKDEKSYKNKRYYWYVHIHLHTTDLLHILFYTTRSKRGDIRVYWLMYLCRLAYVKYDIDKLTFTVHTLLPYRN